LTVLNAAEEPRTISLDAGEIGNGAKVVLLGKAEFPAGNGAAQIKIPARAGAIIKL
jgi:hypothetical protein